MAEAPKAETTTRDFGANANIWQELLQECSRQTDDQGPLNNSSSTVIVLGDKKNGKSAFLNKIKSRVTIPDAPDYVLDYSYLNVKNRFNKDGDATLGRMGMWSLDDASHASLLSHLCKDPSKLGWVVTLDLSKPWSVEAQLDRWLAVVKEANEGLLQGVQEGQRKAMLAKVSRTVQFYSSPGSDEKTQDQEANSTPAPAAGGEEAAEAVKDEEKTAGEGANDAAAAADAALAGDEPPATDAVEVDLSLPEVNLGVPLLVVGLKADFFEKGLQEAGAEDKFEFLVKRLRQRCLPYGASLLLSSSVAEGTNVLAFQEYLYHRVLDFPLQQPPKVVGSVSDFGLFVPSGMDSASLIEAGGSAVAMDSKMEEVFPAPANQGTSTEEVQAVVQAQDNEAFFSSLKNQLEKGSPAKMSPARSAVSGSPGSPGSASKKGGKAVKSFFKTLMADAKK